MNTEYRGFTIKPKLDFGRFGYYIGGEYVKEGFVCTDGICNIMPGATWSQTLEGSKRLIDAYIESEFETVKDSSIFWAIVKRQNAELGSAP